MRIPVILPVRLDSTRPHPARRAGLLDLLLAGPRVALELAGAAAAAPALVAAMTEAVAGFEVFLARADGVREEAAEVTRGAVAVTAQAAELVATVTRLVGIVDATAVAAAATAARAQDVVGQAEGLAADAVELAADAYPVVTAGLPVAAELAPDLLAALRELVDRVPHLLRMVDTELVPLLRELRRTPADVEALKESVEGMEPTIGDMEAELAGLPGAKVLRRRGRKDEAPPPRRP